MSGPSIRRIVAVAHVSRFFFFMPKTRAQKETQVQELATAIKNSKAAVFASFSAVTVKEAEKLRNECRKQDVHYFVAKKSLMNIALKDAGYADADVSSYSGSVAIALAMADEISAAKVLAPFAKEKETFVIGGGILEGRIIDATQVKSLASLPSREELLGKMVGSLNAPVSGFVNVLAGTLRQFVQVVSAIKDAKV